MIAATSFGTRRGPWIVGTTGLAAAGFYDLVRQPPDSRAPERDVMGVLDLACRQITAAAPFAPGQIAALRGDIVRLVPVTSPRWRRRLRRLYGRPVPVLRVETA
ncbi:MAG TPA: hypothetical protein VGL46_21545 [Pseudonocardiaceae bacterium]